MSEQQSQNGAAAGGAARAQGERVETTEETSARRSKSIEEKRSVFISNLPHGTNWRRLKEFMEQTGTVLFARIAMYPDGSSRGYGFAEYADAESAARAVRELDSANFDGHSIRVREQTLQPTLKSCLIANLPWSVTTEELTVIFGKLPGFELARVLLDNTGRSRGRAVVSFRSKEEAENCVKVADGSDVGGRQIKVREMNAEGQQDQQREGGAGGAHRGRQQHQQHQQQREDK